MILSFFDITNNAAQGKPLLQTLNVVGIFVYTKLLECVCCEDVSGFNTKRYLHPHKLDVVRVRMWENGF